jgi:ComF family protein
MATLITDLKYQARFMAARILARSFCDGLNAVSPPHDKPQLLIPIPLHYTKQRRRGFNQTCVLGRPVARHLGIPLAPHALRRHGIAPPQVGLSGAARRRNVKDAFIANTAVRGMHVALFDDVVTTGATAMAASIALLEAGAARVDLWAVARAEGPLTGLRSARGLPRAQEEKGST